MLLFPKHLTTSVPHTMRLDWRIGSCIVWGDVTTLLCSMCTVDIGFKCFRVKSLLNNTGCGLRIAHRKWNLSSSLGTAGPGNILGCCFVSFHFLWAILWPHPVLSNSCSFSNKQQTKIVSQCPECTAENFTTFLHASMAAAD